MQKKDIIQIWITGVLVAVLIVLVVKTFVRPKRVAPAKVFAAADGSQVPAPLAQPKGAGDYYVRLEEETKDLELGRDPFFKEKAEVLSGPSLEGIVWDERNPTAVINETIVGVGTEILGFTVIEIRKTEVLLINNTDGETLKLELFR